MTPTSFLPFDDDFCTGGVPASQWSSPLTWRLYRSFSFGRQWSTRHVTIKNSDIWGFINLSNALFGCWGCLRCIFLFFFSFILLYFGMIKFWCWDIQLYHCRVIRVNAGRWGKKYLWNNVCDKCQTRTLLRAQGLGGARWISARGFIGTWDGILQRIKRIFIILAPILIHLFIQSLLSYDRSITMNHLNQTASPWIDSILRRWEWECQLRTVWIYEMK